MFFNKTNTFVAAALLAVLAGCSQSSVDPGATAEADNAAAIAAYNKDSLKAQAQKDPTSGMYYLIRTANPTGKLPAVGDEVGYTYKFFTLSNTVIDQRDTVVYAPYGTGGFVTDVPFKYLRTGETGTFLLPSSLAFGSQALTKNGVTVLPAYSAVRLDAKLVSSLTEEEQINQYIAKNKLTVTETTTTGLRLIKTKENPAGAALTTGQIVSVVYSGKFLRGLQPFDSGTLPVTLGANRTVAGFEEGIRKLKVGEKATIIFPSSQGYGATGYLQNNQYSIYPYAPLVFDIEIASAQ